MAQGASPPSDPARGSGVLIKALPPDPLVYGGHQAAPMGSGTHPWGRTSPVHGPGLKTPGSRSGHMARYGHRVTDSDAMGRHTGGHGLERERQSTPPDQRICAGGVASRMYMVLLPQHTCSHGLWASGCQWVRSEAVLRTARAVLRTAPWGRSDHGSLTPYCRDAVLPDSGAAL